jgi:hypothetical protein
MQTPAAEDPLTVAARSHRRLVRALRRIGITVGSGTSRLYADIDSLGGPVVVFGPLDADAADRLSNAVENGQSGEETGDAPCQ